MDADNAEGSAIYINTQLKPAYRIKLTASQGGSVTLKRGENAITGNETYGITDDKFTLTSTPDNGYLFDGWFNGETKLSGEATFSYTIASADIEIQGKFVQSNMTQSYASRRAEFKAVCGIELPELEGLEVSDFDYQEGATSYCFDITDGDNLSQETYTTLKSFFNGFDGLPGFAVTLPEDNQQNGSTIEWTSTAGTWVQLVWNSENTNVYVNVRAEYVDPIPSTFAEARNCLKDINGIEIPDYEGAEIGETGASFKKDGTETTFSFTSNELTNTDFNNLKALFSQKFGDATNEYSEENAGTATWNHEGTIYGIEWVSVDKTTIDINIFKN